MLYPVPDDSALQECSQSADGLIKALCCATTERAALVPHNEAQHQGLQLRFIYSALNTAMQPAAQSSIRMPF